MNSNTLKKCIDELQKDKPRIEYVLGMLETLYEMQTSPSKREEFPPFYKVTPKPILDSNSIESKDEGALLDMEAKAKLDKVKQMSKYE